MLRQSDQERKCLACAAPRQPAGEEKPLLCTICNIKKPKANFSVHQQRHANGRKCKACSSKVDGLWRCNSATCQKRLEKKFFSKWSAATGTGKFNDKQVCDVCFQARRTSADTKDDRRCSKCGVSKLYAEYLHAQWASSDAVRRCKACLGDQSRPKRNHWTCCKNDCKKTLPQPESFNLWLKTQTTKRANGWQRCNECFTKEAQLEADVKKRNLDALQLRKGTDQGSKRARK